MAEGSGKAGDQSRLVARDGMTPPCEWTLADYESAVAMDRERSEDNSLRDGSRILFDGKPGTVVGGGYEEEHGWCIDIDMDDGRKTWARSGSPRLKRIVEEHHQLIAAE